MAALRAAEEQGDALTTGEHYKNYVASLRKMGNAQSSRLPMTVVDETGKRRSGVFTKAETVKVVKPYREMLDRVAAQSKFLRSSGKFRSMVASVKAAGALSDQLKKEVGENGALDRNDPKVKAQLEKADKAMAKVRKDTEAYLLKKMKEKGVTSLDQLKGKHEYEQKRIDYAKKLMESVKEYEGITNPDKARDKAQSQSLRDAVKDRMELAQQRKQPKQDKGGPEHT